jgi:imidazolonepropionase-like amidohydrolase
VVDVGGAYVIPGAIDVHTHMALPVGAVRSADDFESGTLAVNPVTLSPAPATAALARLSSIENTMASVVF